VLVRYGFFDLITVTRNSVFTEYRAYVDVTLAESELEFEFTCDSEPFAYERALLDFVQLRPATRADADELAP
jgi:hypothetical protein